jgi:hypothetical protein
MTTKGRLIMDTLRINQLDPEYYRPSMLASHPTVWPVSANGFIVDARSLPKEIQAECVAPGLIPFMPPAG